MAKVFQRFEQFSDQLTDKVQSQLATLQPRDRVALIILSVFLGITLIASALWFTHQAALKQQQRLTEMKDTITWMQTNVVQFSDQGNELTTPNEKIQRLAQQQGLSVQMQDQAGQVKFIVSHQNYAVLANFLTQLAKQGVNIVQMEMQKPTDNLIQLSATVE